MSKDIEATGLLIDLDSLFDTRLGTLILNNYDQLLPIFTGNKYHIRLDDSFHGSVDKDKFYEAYAKRDKETLANSTLTLAIDIVKDFVATTLKADPTSPVLFYPKVYINIYPYKLDQEEVDNIVLGLHSHLKGKAQVEAISLNPTMLTIDYINQHLSVIIMYEYNKWLDAQTELGSFKTKACPSVTLMAPRIFFANTPKSATEVDKTFTLLDNIAKPFINLELLPSIFFSTYLKTRDLGIKPESAQTEETTSTG